MHKKLTLLIAAGALGIAVAGCGSSKAPGVQLAPSNGATAPAATSTTSTTASATSTTAAVTTPKTGVLSKPPKITIPKGNPPTKLVVKNLITGTGATVKAGDTVAVNYVGYIYKSGKEFASSFSEGETLNAALSSTSSSTGESVIPGWIKGIPGMKVGGRRELIIPPSLAYGSSKSGSIPANSTLIFVIDALKIVSK